MAKKSKPMLGITLLVVAAIIISAVFAAYEFSLKDEEDEVELEEIVIDNRISPLEEQGLIFEVLRIRHRGLMEKLLTRGTSWRIKPDFYFKTNIDGLEYISKYVEQHGKIEEITFNTWDTIFQENKIFRNVDPENETATATLTIMETVKSGLLGRKTSDVEGDSLTVTYDFRTGRWSGDDNFKDSDGYGHYLGETFEIWFNIYQVDYDSDFIPYWTEVNVLGTDPMIDDSKRDPDEDGVPTAWEWKWGYDPFTWDNHEQLDPDLDGIENIEEYQLRNYFADPFSQDVYYEVDFMESGGFGDPPHILFEETKQGLIERYAEHNMKLYFDDGWPGGPSNGGGEFVKHYDKVTQDSGMMLQYYNNHFPEERRGSFRYMLLGHGGGFNHPSVNNIYDTVQLFTYSGLRIKDRLKSFINMGYYPTPRGNRIGLGASILHESAHSCGVDADLCEFGGIDNLSGGWWLIPNKDYPYTAYRSVLNYNCMYDPTLFDLSDGENGAPYDQDDWSMFFCGHFQLNSKLFEETFYSAGEAIMEENEWWVSGYELDDELTEKFKQDIGDWTPVHPKPVDWRVYKLKENEGDENSKDIKVFAKIDTHNIHTWVLNLEGNLDSDGNMEFYSQNAAIEQVNEYIAHMEEI